MDSEGENEIKEEGSGEEFLGLGKVRFQVKEEEWSHWRKKCEN